MSRVVLEAHNVEKVNDALRLGTKKDASATSVLTHLKTIKKIIEGNTAE